MSGELAWLLAGLAATGLFAGFVGGLFGVGGGAVLVPVLYALFALLNVDDSVRMHLAVGTSLSTIVATSWRSLSAHQRAGAVDREVLQQWGPWIAAGALAGATLAGFAQTAVLLAVFGVGLLLVALHMAFASPAWRLRDELPGGLARVGVAGAIGAVSAMMGIGGGAFGVTLMTLCGRPIHQAVATASGFGAAIAAPAALIYIATGLGREGLPPWSLGFVSLPGFVALALLTALSAPWGARLAHTLPQQALKRAFAAFLAFMALNMLREAFVV